MKQLLNQVIPLIQNGEVIVTATTGDFRGIIGNVVIYSKAGDFFLKFSDLRSTPPGIWTDETELPCWDILKVLKNESTS